MIIILLLSTLHLTGALVALSTAGNWLPPLGHPATLPHCFHSSTVEESLEKRWWNAVGSRRCIVDSEAVLLPTTCCHYDHILLRKMRTFYSKVEIPCRAWGFSGRHLEGSVTAAIDFWTLMEFQSLLTEDRTRLAKASQIQTVPAYTMKNGCWGSSSTLCQFKVDSIVVPEHQPIKVRYNVLWGQEARIELAVQAKGWKSPWGSSDNDMKDF